jgi:hypothetical protein
VSVTIAGEEVQVVQPAEWMTDPPWFLLTGLPWPEDSDGAEMAEAALAITPAVTRVVRPVGPDGQPVPLGRDLALMLAAGSQCAAALSKRVVFLSDITRWLADNGLNWERIGVDFPAAQDELDHQTLGLLVMVSRRAYTILCSTRALRICNTSGSTTEISSDEREQLRASFEAVLNADWPRYVAKALADAKTAA